MGFLRTIYDGLALIGAVFIAFVVVAVGASTVKRWLRPSREAAERTVPAPAVMDSQPGRSAALATAEVPLLPLGKPMGLTEARERGLTTNAEPRVFLQVSGRTFPGARKFWVERHARDQYLLVTNDSYIAGPRQVGSRWALQLRSGEQVAMQKSRGLAGVTYAYADLCRPPEDSLLVIAVPSTEQLAVRSSQCR